MTQVFYRKIQIFKWQVSLPVLLWLLLAIVGALVEVLRGTNAINNFLIFKGVFEHSLLQLNLYNEYPLEYMDNNHYGPSFSILIAPFAMLNVYIGCFLWCMANAVFLLFAIQQLPISKNKQLLILLVGSIEMLTSIQNVQFNPMLTGFIILALTLVQKEKDFWATLFIAAGFLIKLYGIVGLAFFFFSKHKLLFVWSFFFWLTLLFCLPMLYTSPSFIATSYVDWFEKLAMKNEKNANAPANNFMQDISVFGIIRRIFKIENLSNILVLVPAAIIYFLPFLRRKQFKYTGFQLSYLALALIGVVIFSTSAESSTYIIAMIGVGIWYILHNQTNKLVTGVVVFALLFTSLSATDLFPEYLRLNFIRPYSLKALPCFLVWLLLVFDLLKTDFSLAKENYA